MDESIFVHGFASGVVQSIVGHPLDTVKTRIQTGKKLSWKGLYQGFFPSLLGGCVQNGFLFSIENQSHSFFKNENKFLSGFTSGVLTSFLVSPLERWKCKAQTGLPMKGSWYQGMKWTIGRDGFGFGTYFYIYDVYKEKWGVFWAGGMAGVLSWWVSYPFDIKKTLSQIQTPKITSNNKLGVLVVSVRAFIVNGSLFTFYENSFKEW